MANNRFYRFNCITYLSQEDLKTLLRQHTEHWAISPYHDKDNCEPHFHFIATFTQQKSIQSVVRIFDNGKDNTRVYPLDDLELRYRYFWHLDDPDKFQYDHNLGEDDGTDYWSRLKRGEGENDKNGEFLNDLLSDDYDLRKMGMKYGRDFIKNYKAYEAYRVAVWERENGNLFSFEDEMLMEKLRKKYPWYYDKAKNMGF